MDTLTIKTDHTFHNFLYGYELTTKEKEDFDYIPADEIDSHDFFRYRGQVYDPNEFMATGLYGGCPFKDWDGYNDQTYFSGILIKYSEDGEQYQVGTYYS